MHLVGRAGVREGVYMQRAVQRRRRLRLYAVHNIFRNSRGRFFFPGDDAACIFMRGTPTWEAVLLGSIDGELVVLFCEVNVGRLSIELLLTSKVNNMNGF